MNTKVATQPAWLAEVSTFFGKNIQEDGARANNDLAALRLVVAATDSQFHLVMQQVLGAEVYVGPELKKLRDTVAKIHGMNAEPDLPRNTRYAYPSSDVAVAVRKTAAVLAAVQRERRSAGKTPADDLDLRVAQAESADAFATALQWATHSGGNPVAVKSVLQNLENAVAATARVDYYRLGHCGPVSAFVKSMKQEKLAKVLAKVVDQLQPAEESIAA